MGKPEKVGAGAVCLGTWTSGGDAGHGGLESKVPGAIHTSTKGSISFFLMAE